MVVLLFNIFRCRHTVGGHREEVCTQHRFFFFTNFFRCKRTVGGHGEEVCAQHPFFFLPIFFVADVL